MKGNMGRILTDYFKDRLEGTEGTDLWPAVRTRLAERNAPSKQEHRKSWFRSRRFRIVSAVACVLIVAIVLSLWMIPSANAKEIVKKAREAQVLGTNTGIRTFFLTQKISERGESQAEIQRWYQEPGLWRFESVWNGPGLTDEITILNVSDGTSEWIQQGDAVTINWADPQPDADDLTPWGHGNAGLTAVLNQVSDVYTSPRLKGKEKIAGRTAYVIDLGLPNRFSNSAPEINNGRRVIWVDTETFFLLKAVQYSPTDGSAVWTMEVTDIRYNIPIDPELFSYTPPQGAQVHDYRSDTGQGTTTPEPEPSPPGVTGLIEARKKVSFPVFIPTAVPDGLTTENVSMDERPPNFVRVDYRTKYGSAELSVLNGPAGSGLDADPRKTGETIEIRDGIAGHFIDNQPEYGGPILWWDEAGSYVALSGPKLTKADLIKIAESMSSTADNGSQSK